MFNYNEDFYPTPANLINKMLSNIDFRYVKTVLEPSAGKGDLVEAITKEFNNTNRYRSTQKYDIDTIEFDENLRYILQGKNHRVIADDFLTFDSFKKYDVIIMNPPFSQGDKHLLKAIEMQSKGGKIVCLLNAETVKNPYSNTRKDLRNKLEQLNAKIEYINDGFTDAERKTNVETALVYIDIPEVERDSVILEELKRSEQHSIKRESDNYSLIDSDFINGIVQQYNYEVKAGLKLIEEYNSLKPLMLKRFDNNSNPVLKLSLEFEDKEGSSLENGYIKQIRSKYWQTLFNNDQFMGLFTSNLKRKYVQYVEELKDYDFSLYNIYTLRLRLSKEMTHGLEETILNLFEEFSHKHYYDESSKNIHLYNGWKTNQSYKINKKVIIPLNGYDDFWGKYNPTRYQVLDKLKDIEKVFNYLDNGQSVDIDLTEALKVAEQNGDTKKIDLKFFKVTFFKKGTCHIEFKDMELLHKFNLFGSQQKGWLPPSYGKATYKDMTTEEKNVIDQFEGKESYNNVMNNKSYFIMNTEELLKLTP